MFQPIEAKLIIEKDGFQLHNVSLSYEALSSLASCSPDSDASTDLFATLSQHPSSSVRERIAYKENLNEDTVLALAVDPSVDVLRNLIRTSAFRRYITDDLLIQIIGRDVEAACFIAENLELLENIDRHNILRLLVLSDDPAIVAAVAGNTSTPKKILKELLRHPDVDVVDRAKQNIDK